MLQGQQEVGLNEKGERQAEKLAKRFEDEDVDAVYSSDLERASRTAEKVAAETGAPHIETEKLRERAYGDFPGKYREDRRSEIDEADELDDWRPEGGENVHDVRERASQVLDEVEQEYTDGTVIIVGHGWVNRSLITDILDAQDGRAHSIIQDNTGVHELRKDDYRGWRIVKLNDTSHI